MRKEKGITLVALIITIIILVILVGVSVNVIINSDIISSSKRATESYSIEKAREKLEIAITALSIQKKGKVELQNLIEINEEGISVKTIKEGNSESVEINTEDNRKYGIVYVDGIEFKVYDNLEIVLVGKNNENISVDTDFEKLQQLYTQDGLIVWYDGIYNTKEGHDNATTIWKNLVEDSTANDGILMNVNNTESSGWTSNSLILDGEDDWVKMSYINFESMTIEIVAKPLDVNTEKAQFYIANIESGGISIRKSTNNKNMSEAYIKDSYKGNESSKDIKINQIYSMSTGVDNGRYYFRENEDTYENKNIGLIQQPKNSTVFALGTNPSVTDSKLAIYEALFNMEVYSVRIYNRCLSEEEVIKNYESDKARFNITQIEEQEELGYVTKGLVCLYDGEQNTPYGHSKTNSSWVDISGNGNNGILKNVNNTERSGWTSNSLILDGEDDWVAMFNKEMATATIEIVAKPIKCVEEKSQFYISNIQGGGRAIICNGKNKNVSSIYTVVNSTGSYKVTFSDQEIQAGKTYSLSSSYDRTKQYFRENETTYSSYISGTYKEPNDSTVFALGTNPSGTDNKLGSNEVLFNMEVYSVRIYNRCLSEEEIQKNYEIDKARFNI